MKLWKILHVALVSACLGYFYEKFQSFSNDVLKSRVVVLLVPKIRR